MVPQLEPVAQVVEGVEEAPSQGKMEAPSQLTDSLGHELEHGSEVVVATAVELVGE